MVSTLRPTAVWHPSLAKLPTRHHLPKLSPLPRFGLSAASLASSYAPTPRLATAATIGGGPVRKDQVQAMKGVARAKNLEELQRGLDDFGYKLSELGPAELHIAIARLRIILKEEYRGRHQGLQQHPLVQQMAAAFRDKYKGMTADSLADSIGAFVKVRLTDTQLILQATSHIATRLDDITAGKYLVNLLYSLATLSQQGLDKRATTELNMFFITASQQVATRAAAGQLDSFSLSNALYSCALVGHRDPHMAGVIAKQATRIIEKFNSQDVGNLLWSWAKLGLPVDQGRFSSAASAAIQLKDSMTTQAPSNILLAHATANHHHQQLFDELAARAVQVIHTFKPQDLSNTAWACSKLRYYNQQLMTAIASRVCEVPSKQFTPQNTANLLYAYAMLPCHELGQDVVVALLQQATQKVQHMTWQEHCNSAWALAVLASQGQPTFHHPAAKSFWHQLQLLLVKEQSGTHHDEDLCQLFLAQQAAKALGAQDIFTLTGSSSTAADEVKAVQRIAYMTKQHSASTFHRISSILQQSPPAADVQQLQQVPFYFGPIDITLQWQGHEVAVVLQPERAFTSNQPHLPLGGVMLRNWLLQRHGWAVVVVPFWEFATIDEQHLVAKLEVAVAAAAAAPADLQLATRPLASGAAAPTSSKPQQSTVLGSESNKQLMPPPRRTLRP